MLGAPLGGQAEPLLPGQIGGQGSRPLLQGNQAQGCLGQRSEKLLHHKLKTTMKGEFTAIIEPAPEGGFWAVCPEVPGANGQGETVEEAKQNLIEAIELLFEDRRADFLRGLPEGAIREKVLVG